MSGTYTQAQTSGACFKPSKAAHTAGKETSASSCVRPAGADPQHSSNCRSLPESDPPSPCKDKATVSLNTCAKFRRQILSALYKIRSAPAIRIQETGDCRQPSDIRTATMNSLDIGLHSHDSDLVHACHDTQEVHAPVQSMCSTCSSNNPPLPYAPQEPQQQRRAAAQKEVRHSKS